MSLSRNQRKYLLTRLYRFLEDGHEIRFEKQRGYAGRILYPESKEHAAYIGLDHRRDVISTLIHEFIHFLHPHWSESDVLKLESSLVNSLSETQVKNIIKKMADAL